MRAARTRRRSWFQTSSPPSGLFTGWYKNCLNIPQGSHVPHGGYTSGLNHDSVVRPRYDRAYVYALAASYEWAQNVLGWVSPGFAARVKAYNPSASDAKDLAYDQKASIYVSEWIENPAQHRVARRALEREPQRLRRRVRDVHRRLDRLARLAVRADVQAEGRVHRAQPWALPARDGGDAGVHGAPDERDGVRHAHVQRPRELRGRHRVVLTGRSFRRASATATPTAMRRSTICRARPFRGCS